MTRARLNEKELILIEEVLILTKEEIILILEVDFMVNFIYVVVKDIDPLNAKVMVRMLVEMV